MSLDLNKLAGAAARARAQRAPARGAAALVSGLRRDPATRDLLPIQTQVLPPIPWATQQQWRLSALLAAPTPTAGLQKPWGLVTWRFSAPGQPSGAPTVTDLRTLPAAAPVLDQLPDAIPFQPSRSPASSGALYRSLDALLGLPAHPLPDLSALGPRYTDLLPPVLHGLIHTLVPGSAGWLAP